MANKLVYILTGVFVLFLVVVSVISIYREGLNMIPGITPNVYKRGQTVSLWVNKVTSVHSPLPYRYHDLPVCVPENLEKKSESLGEIITGNRIENSSYQINFQIDQTMAAVCAPVKVDEEKIKKLQELIKLEYVATWQLDGLPIKRGGENNEIGFPIGEYSPSANEEVQYKLYNYVQLKIYFNKHNPVLESTDPKNPILDAQTNTNEFDIVLFEVTPKSADAMHSEKPFYLKKDTKEIPYFYDVTFDKSDITWSNRWHSYTNIGGEGQIHWFSIINSLMIVFFLSGMVAMILARTVKRDFARYMDREEKDEIEETGWKLVHGDVFRPPPRRGIFSVLIGSGIQVLFMCVITMVFAVLGLLSPSNQGSIITAVLVLYVWMGVAAGYSSSRIYIMFEGDHHTRNTLMTAFFFPGVIFIITFILNLFMSYSKSSGAFPPTTLLAIMALWFCISVPLCFLGSRLAYRKDPPKHPGVVNQIPRSVPSQKWYKHTIATALMGGILPFGAVFIELFFIMTSIWFHKFYFLFGFLFLVFLILIITCAEIAVVMCYFQLCDEDWHWWWRSFLTPATSALYMFLYAIFYYITRLEVDGFIPTLVYFGYSIILCLFFFVLTGTIGFYSCYWFVKKIYGAIHQD